MVPLGTLEIYEHAHACIGSLIEVQVRGGHPVPSPKKPYLVVSVERGFPALVRRPASALRGPREWQPLWLRRCLWSSQLGLTFSNDLSEHGPGTPTMRAHSATVLRHTPTLALLTRRVLGLPARRFITKRAVRCLASRSPSLR